MKEKNIGVKQGCPISPRLFNTVLDGIIQKTIKNTKNFNKEEETLRLPLILAYADDIIILTEREKDLENFLNEIKPNLKDAGMNINFEKSTIMIRDPSGKEKYKSGEEHKIGQHKLKTTNKMKYLGTFLTNNLNRRETVRERTKRAHIATKIILPFIEKHRPNWNITKNIYTTVILPIMTYGVKTAALTKANRRSLRRAEKNIIQLIAKASNTSENRTTKELLNGKTITKRISTYSMKFWGHILRREREHLLKKALKITEDKKKVGRPCYTWNTTLERIIQKSRIEKGTWERWAKEKETLKKEVNRLYELSDTDTEEDNEE